VEKGVDTLDVVPKAVKAKKTKPRKRASRKIPDLDEVIEITIQLILKHGDSGFRIDELIELTGISKSSLYLHFGDRDGLVGAAMSTAYLRDVKINVDGAIALVSGISTRKQMLDAIPILVNAALNTRNIARWQRVMVLSSARHRPEMLKRISEAQTMIDTALEELLREKQKQGIVRKDLDAREIGVLMQTAIIGQIFRDIDSKITAKDLDKWRAVLESVYEGFMA
jgi:AcrR family transcriptional regulator